jgi:putative nucleotidyltransferase with HDIG domain
MYHRTFQRHDERLAETLAKTLGLRDPNLPVHSLRVSNFAAKLARRLGVPEEQVDIIRRGSLLHDIGKLGISQDILSKPAALSAEEHDIVKTHPFLGATLLRECAEYEPLIPIVLHHHEYFNGQGYPDRIAGNQIELEARIVSVAEAVDVMLSDSPYRRSLSIPHAIIELRKCTKIQFDPLIVETAVQLLTEADREERTGCPSSRVQTRPRRESASRSKLFPLIA